MERTALLGRLSWQLGEVVATQAETARTKSITLALPTWMGHRAGQHVDVRLTAQDGYQAERSYSIASPPEEQPRGPIGGYFVWEAHMGGPLLLVAGGSGMVPLMAMLRHRAAVGSTVPTRLLYSSRSSEDVIYRDELDRLVKSTTMLEVVQTLTRVQPPGWTGYHRRVDTEMLREVAWPTDQRPLMFICGPTPFVETAAASLVTLGDEPARIKTERFGPTGEA